MKSPIPLLRFLLSTVVVLVFSLATAVAQFNCVAPAAGMVGWWRAEGSGNDSVGTNAGTLFGGPTFTNGEVGQALSFDGLNDFVGIPASSTLDVGTGDGLTMEGWINPTDVNATHALWEWNDGVGDYGVHVWFSIPDYGGVRSIFANLQDVANNDHYLATAPGLIAAGSFQHIALTYSKSNGTAKIYYNGTVVANQNLGVFTPQTSQKLYFGMRPAGPSAGSYFNGVMDEVSLYNRALSDAEIVAIFNASNAGKCPPAPPTTCATPPSGLVHWWAAEGSAVDTIGSLNGSLYGGTTFAPGKVGLAFSFNGVSDSITNTMFGLTNILDSYTMELWAWPTAERASTAESTTGIDGHGNQRYAIFPYPGPTGETVGSGISVGTNGVSVFEAGNAYLPALLVYDAPITGWTHIAVVYSNRQPSLYVNGVLVRTGLTSVNPSCPSTWLGERGPASANQGYYAGLLDEVSIYSRSLSASEIQAVYSAGSGGKCGGPVPLSIFSQPSSQTVTEGGLATFQVIAGGAPPLSYQWRFNGTNIDAATNSSLVLTTVQLAQAGNYAVLVTNTSGSLLSSNAVLMVNPLPSCAALPSGFVSWWRGEGNGVDSVVGNDGVLQGGISFIPGEVGQALLFNGTDAVLSIIKSPNLDVGVGGALSIEAWVKPESAAMMPLVEWNSGAGGSPYGVHLWASVAGGGSLFANVVDTAGNYHVVQTAAGLLTTGTFQHVALTYDKSTGQGKVYLNGQVVALENLGVFTPQTSYNCYLGSRPAGGLTWYTGALDEVSIYNRALASTEIQAIYNAGSAGKCTTPVPPHIFSQPTNQTVSAGATAALVVAAGGTPPLSYQWSLDGSPVVDATNASLILPNVGNNRAGVYAVTVTNLQGSIVSSNAVLTVLTFPPTITVQPAHQTVVAGDTAALAVVADGTPPFGYQWNLNGSPLADATGASLTLTNVGTNQAGNYSVMVTNLYGSMLSSNASLSVLVLATNLFDDFEPGIHLAQWSSFGGTVLATNYGGFVSSSHSLWFGGAGSRYAMTRAVQTIGGGRIQFSLRLASGPAFPWETADLPVEGVVLEYSVSGGTNWVEFGRYDNGLYFNWTPISVMIPAGAEGSTTLFRWRQLSNSGAANDHWALDDVLIATAPTPPTVTIQPLNQTVAVGGTATFTVTASGTWPLNYQWRFNELELVGQTGTALTLTNVQLTNAGNYSVVVSNSAGFVTSSNALLTVQLPPATVQVLGPSVMAGSPIEVPVMLVANGNESALSFSLNFNTQRLAFAGIVLGSGASGAVLFPNTNQAASGSLGLITALSAGTFAAGTQEIVRVSFTTSILGGSQPSNTPINFTNQPINTLLADASAQPLPANYINGIVTLSPTDLEGDAAPRPGGDRSLDIFDWVQVGRYVAGLDTIASSNEFQRVDCAPRSTLGDGMLKVTDWVQAGRYAAGLDSQTIIGGPDVPVPPGPAAGRRTPQDASPRTVRIADGEVVNGLTVTLPVMLTSLGNEFGVGFSLNFDPSVLRYTGVSKGSATAAATLNANELQASAGRIGLALVLPSGSSFTAGTQEIVRVTFVAQASLPGNYPVVLGDQPVWRAVSDSTAQELTTAYVNNLVVVHDRPALAISSSGTNVILSWPSWAGDFTLQAADAQPGLTTNWSNTVLARQTNGATVSVTAPASALTRFFRLLHP